jgi:predicted alpha/beta-hydrolase family hydrolase
MPPNTTPDVLTIPTPHGDACAHLTTAPSAVAALLLGHGAGGSIDAPDLLASTAAALDASVTVARIEQPYRVARRRSAAPAHQLDAAWLAVHAALTAPGGPLAGLPILAGGRSSGARVACRTASATEVIGVLCLAFPLHPPQRKADAERKTRLPELELVGDRPVLVIQGERDPFGMPPPGAHRTIVAVPGDHSLKAGVAAVGPAVAAWLPSVLGGAVLRTSGGARPSRASSRSARGAQSSSCP